ncbi:hypothetical protein ABPG77_000379 [Micractinium sp. CCAP 211/92]
MHAAKQRVAGVPGKLKLLLVAWTILGVAAALRLALGTRRPALLDSQLEEGKAPTGQPAAALRRPRASAAQLTVGLLIDARSTAPAAEAAPSGPLSSQLDCNPDQPPHKLTDREVDMQQQRRCALARANGRPPGGYVALCLAVKNQHRELPEYLDYYRRLGVSQVYAMEDPQSDPPLKDVLRPFVQDGFVTHRLMPAPDVMRAEVLNATCHEYHVHHKQLMAYTHCLKDYGSNHQWMGFIDADEFVVLTDGTPDLPTLLRDYEAHGALALNWRMFGSNGHETRQNNTLLSYTKCNAEQAPENTHVKLFANMAYVGRISGPHEALHAPGYYTVNTSRQRVNGSFSSPIDHSRAALNHYILRSKEEFREKRLRGSAMRVKPKPWQYWRDTEATMTEQCDTGVRAWQRLYGAPAPQRGQHRRMGRGT